MIYLDNAATTWPKPEAVCEAVSDSLRNIGGNPGRSGHRMSLESGKTIGRARLSLSKLIGASDPERVVFTCNATDALNLATGGVLFGGGHVVISSMEHNSVTRPLVHLAERGVECTRVRMDPVSGVDPDDVAAAIRTDTKLVVMTHASNVTGTVNPVADIGALCRGRGVLFLVDGAQSVGSLPVDVESMNIDLLAFPGHKGLMGPTGTGGLYIADGVRVRPARQGGTGVFSESPTQPDELPYRYESGTQNFHGLAGLDAGVRFIVNTTLDAIHARESRLVDMLIGGVREIGGVTVYGPPAGANRAAVVSLNIEGVDCAEAAMILDASFDLMLRSGLHCAPDAHRTLGTFGLGGTIRVSPGFFNTEDDIARCVEGITAIASEA
ncbi:MAG: aminotransferase class V-fold PLP-dependent enzyme [Clostridiales Family XIII bacterium]|jgi:cysteine desulfurase family protein|nr:aminotransferase class V-fold PLP-dependent enzyme [Clostridiales Family XIII bacterium]